MIALIGSEWVYVITSFILDFYIVFPGGKKCLAITCEVDIDLEVAIFNSACFSSY